MAIRKPNVSVAEAKRLAKERSEEVAPAPLSASTTAVSPMPHQIVTPVDADPQLVTTLAPRIWAGRREPLPAGIVDQPAVSAHVTKRTPGDAVFPELRPAEPKMQVFLSAPLPAAGISSNFDALSRQYPSHKALQMILRRALDSYEVRLENGSYRSAPTDYVPREPISGILIIQTSRMMPVRLIDIARRHFDPLGFESARAFGRKLACSALATFFESENNSNG